MNLLQMEMQDLFGTTLLTYVIFAMILATGFAWLFRRQERVWCIDQIPGPKALPIVGNALLFNVPSKEIFVRLLEVCESNAEGSVVRLWLGSEANILIYKCEAAEILLSDPKHNDKSQVYIFLQPWLGTGLLTSTGTKWHNRRKMLTPAFHFKILEEFLDIYNQQSEILVSKLNRKADGQPFNIYPLITYCTLDIILEAAMGRKIHAQDDFDSKYVKAIYKMSTFIHRRQMLPWLRPKWLFWLLGYEQIQRKCLQILHNFSYETIRERKKQFLEQKTAHKGIQEEVIGKKKKLAFLDLLLQYSEEGHQLSDEDIREEVDTFMFEGHDTTASSINWMLYLLAVNQEAQNKVHEELDDVFGESNRPVNLDDLPKLKYLEHCIKEALRLFPPVPYIAREIHEDIVIDGYRIPAGTTCIIAIYRLHRDPRYFPDPEKFIPERFLPENFSNRHPFAYLPFSAGPRNCIGQKFAMMEEKIVLANILRKFRVETRINHHDLKLLAELILRSETGNMLILHIREKKIM